MASMERDWGRLGGYVQTARRARVLTQPELGELVGVKRATIQNIESGQEFKKITPTLRAIERELGWAEGSIEKILDGGEPVIEPAPEEVARIGRTESVDSRIADLPVAVQEALTRDGEVMDATVMDVEVPGISGQMIIVVKGKPVAPPAVIARDLHDIAMRYLKLRGITPPDDANGDTAAQA